jgi:hypothetical protein
MRLRTFALVRHPVTQCKMATPLPLRANPVSRDEPASSAEAASGAPVRSGLLYQTLGGGIVPKITDPAHACDITTVAVSRDNRFLVSAGWDRKVCPAPTASPVCRCDMTLIPHPLKIIIWDYANRTPLRQIFGENSHSGVVLSVSVADDCSKVASCSRDKSIMVPFSHR